MFNDIDLSKIQTPCYVIDIDKLTENLKTLKYIKEQTGCKILLAQKAFSCYKLYNLIGEYLDGVTASGLFEAKLGYKYMKKQNHIFSPAYPEKDFDEIVKICDHIIFNSFSQWKKYKSKILKSGKSAGLRINPEFSTQKDAIYDPCSEFSRLGVTLENFKETELEGIEGLHFHTLCEQSSDDLEKTLNAVEKKFGKYFKNIKWINFGGGHHITKDNYDIKKLIKIIKDFKKKYNLEVYLEPGEAVVLNAGYLISKVLEIVNNKMDIAILDTSASCHMPDVIEMPYRPFIINSAQKGEKNNTYRLSSNTCLAGDIIGDYSFDKPLNIGDKLIFTDMALYTMVKNNTFNGINLPSIYFLSGNIIKLYKKFKFKDFKSRL